MTTFWVQKIYTYDIFKGDKTALGYLFSFVDTVDRPVDRLHCPRAKFTTIEL